MAQSKPLSYDIKFTTKINDVRSNLKLTNDVIALLYRVRRTTPSQGYYVNVWLYSTFGIAGSSVAICQIVAKENTGCVCNIIRAWILMVRLS